MGSIKRGDELLRKLALYHNGELQASGPALVAAFHALTGNGASGAGQKGAKASPAE